MQSVTLEKAQSKLAEIIAQYVKKGSLIYIEGKLQTRKWQDKEGKDRYTTEIIADQMQMFGGKPDSGKPSDSQDTKPKDDFQKAKEANFDDFDNNIPF